MGYFEHSLEAAPGEYKRIEIADNPTRLRLQERYHEAAIDYERARTSAERKNAKARMRRAVVAARRVAT
jgi:hypothetical protein